MGRFSAHKKGKIMRIKYILLIWILLLLNLLHCDLDHQQSDMLYDGYRVQYLGNNVVRSLNRVLLFDSYGITVYETIENDLDEILNLNLPKVKLIDMNSSYIALVIFSAEGGPYYSHKLLVYDISQINQPSIVYEEESNILEVFLTSNYLILDKYDRIEVYDIETFELINTYNDFSLKQNIHDSIYFTVKDQGQNIYYLCHLDENGQLIQDYNLGTNFGRVVTQNEQLLYCYQGFIDFYDITDSDSLTFQRTFALSHFAELELPGLIIFDNTMVVPCYSNDNQLIPQLTYYDISDIDNINELGSYEFFPEMGQYKDMRVYDTIQWNNNFLMVIKGFGVIYSDHNNFLDDYTLLKYSRVPFISKNINNKLYVNYSNILGFNNIFDISSLSNITQIENSDSLGTLHWFQVEDNQYVINNNFRDRTFLLYNFNDDSFNYITTFELPQELKNWQQPISLNLWNGHDLIFSFGESIYWYGYEDGIFSLIYQDEVAEIDLSIRWFYYNNYFYKISYQGLLEVYVIQNNSLDLVNTIYWADNNVPSGFVNQWGIEDGLLTIANINPNGVSKIYDLNVDPLNLTGEIDLDYYLMNSKVKRYGDYYFFTGCDNENYTPYQFYEQLSYFNIYKKVGDEFIRVGDIYNHRQTWDFEIVFQGPDDFTVFLCSTRGIDVYSCQATPNGNLDIIPVILNSSNYPNPFNPETTISYHIPKKGHVTIDIYNIKGQKIRSLLKEEQEAGQHSIIWKGHNDQGQKVSSGTYLYRVKSGDEEIVNKMMLVK